MAGLDRCTWLRVPVQGSNGKMFEEQSRLLLQGDEAALVAHHIQTKADLLNSDNTRCKEEAASDFCVALVWNDCRLYV